MAGLERIDKHALGEMERRAYEYAKETIERLGSMGTFEEYVMAGMFEGFVGLHRTQQQDAVRWFVNLMMEWAMGNQSDWVDPRNEGSWKFAKMVATSSVYLPRI